MSDNPEEASNHHRFLAAFIDLATETVLKLFYKYQPKASAHAFFTTSQTKSILKKALSKNVYFKVTHPTVNPDRFDISLLIKLLRSLFTDKLDPPHNGWGGCRPLPTHTNIADDLERLRRMRNKVFHSYEAKLSRVEYENLFQELKGVLTRLVREVEPGSENSLTEKFDSYKTMTLVPSENEKWLSMLQEWLDGLQEKDDELLTKGGDYFNMLLEKKQEKYDRYLQLLVDGGRLVLTAYLNDLLEKQKLTVDIILIDNRSALQKELSNPELIKQLYPTTEEDTVTTNIDTNSWDLIVLAQVILTVFGTFIHRPDIDAIEGIMRARKYYAATAIESFDRDRFSHYCEDLVSSIRNLSGSIRGEVYSQCQKLIERYRSQKDKPNIAKIYKQLESPALGIASLIDEYKEILRQLRYAILDTLGSGVYFKSKQVLNMKITLLCEDPEKRTEVERKIFAFLQAVLKYSGKELDSQEISGIKDILECLGNIPNVELMGVKTGSIILSIKSQSKEGLLALIDYIDGPLFQQHLAEVADQFEVMYNQVFSLQGHFTLESLHKAHRDNFKPQQDEGIVLPIACSSPEEIERFDMATPVYQEESIYEREMTYSKMRPTLKIPAAITQLDHYLESQSLYEDDSISEIFRQEGKRLCLEYEEILQKENANYTRQLQAYQEEQARLTIVIQTLREEVTQFMEKADNLEVDLKDLRTRYDETKRREDTQKELNTELINQLNQLRDPQDEIIALKRENIYYETELEDATRTISRFKHENSTMKIRLDQIGGESIAIQSDNAKLSREVKELQAQLVHAQNQYIERLAESEEARLNAARQAARKEYSYTMQDHLERTKWEKQIEHSEKERQVLEHRLKKATEENINMSTRMIEMKIKISEVEDQYSEWVSKSLPREAAYKREIHDLKEDLAAEMHLRYEFLKRNIRISEEIRAIRKKLDIVDEDQTMARRNLEIDLENVQQRKSPTRPHQWRWSQTTLRTGRNEMKTYKQSPYLIPRKKINQI